MTILHLSLALVADPINAIIPSVIVFLSWAAGMYWFGPSDAAKRIKGIKHDGRRFVYRGAMVAAVCGLIWWATSWPISSAILTLLASGFAMSIGVRVGFNAAAGLDWRYLGSTSADDRWWIFVLALDPLGGDWSLHDNWYKRNLCGYAKEVHRAGLIRTLVEALLSLLLLTLTMWA